MLDKYYLRKHLPTYFYNKCLNDSFFSVSSIEMPLKMYSKVLFSDSVRKYPLCLSPFSTALVYILHSMLNIVSQIYSSVSITTFFYHLIWALLKIVKL